MSRGNSGPKESSLGIGTDHDAYTLSDSTMRPIPTWTVELAGSATLWLLMKSATDHSARRPEDGKLFLREGKAPWVVTIVVFFLQPALFLELANRRGMIEPGDGRAMAIYVMAYVGPGVYIVANLARRWALVDGWGVVAQPLWGTVQRMAWHEVTEVQARSWSLTLKSGPYKEIRISKYVAGLPELLQEVRAHVPDHICEDALQQMADKMGIRDE
jgi:hypothetical protein